MGTRHWSTIGFPILKILSVRPINEQLRPRDDSFQVFEFESNTTDLALKWEVWSTPEDNEVPAYRNSPILSLVLGAVGKMTAGVLR